MVPTQARSLVLDAPRVAGAEVRILEAGWSAGGDFAHAVGSEEEALLIVRGGSATVARDQSSAFLLTPVHAFHVEQPARLTVSRHSAGTRCTVLVYPREAVPSIDETGHDLASAIEDPRRSLLPLSAAALLHFYWSRRRLSGGASSTPREVVESARTLRMEALACGASCRATSLQAPPRRARRAVAERVQARLSSSVDSPHRLADVARAVGTSPFHLARIFRDETGLSLHQFLVRLRLIAALDRLSAGAHDLSVLALDLGFSNHSHFSVAFRRAFGIVPSEARSILTRASSPDTAPPWAGGGDLVCSGCR